MSLRTPSLLGLLACLQRHGLTQAQLAAFAALCQAQHSGQVIFQVAEGRIRSVEAVTSERQRARLLHD